MDGSRDNVGDVGGEDRFRNTIGRNFPWADGRRNSLILPSLAADDAMKDAAISTMVKSRMTFKSRVLWEYDLERLVRGLCGTSTLRDDVIGFPFPVMESDS